MASPRSGISIYKCLSPNISTIRHTTSPKTPVRNSLTLEDIFANHKVSPIFNIDSPYKKKIVNEGFLEQHHTVLGNGAFGTVYKAYYKGKKVAAKIIKSNNKGIGSVGMEREAAFLRHMNIIKILNVDEGPVLTLITMELCGNSLQNILEESSITKHQRIHIWQSIAKALKYCHKMGIVHADVKPKNVLMGMDDQPKLADFGSAVFVNDLYIPFDFHGTPGYAAPEVVRGKLPTPLSDIYSLAILAWQMLSRKPPFAGLHTHTILYLTGKGITPIDYTLNDGFQGKYKDLYKKCWNKQCDERLNLLTILKKLKILEINIFKVSF
ncbi:PREDICTED: serine/threonine-protein kinase mos [Ceratosolen solmsi marchali]|uniref:non-specific serine/threonine protein kinase n=1 Tax=Ceratosolen solmsi marchali TaxID=326594 RepID=A0AAJ7DTG2_9HYME|nr:PREDICTED: serine/threonine-protein kinase mos [Ceratosolen solmsi marchali]